MDRESLHTQTGTFMREIGTMTKQMVMGFTSIQMEPNTKASGLTTRRMERGMRLGLMVQNMKENTRTGRNRALASTFGGMVPSTGGSGRKIKSTGRGFIAGKTAEFTKASGPRTIWMALASTVGLTEGNTWGSSLRTRNKAMGYTIGMMAGAIAGISSRGNSTGLECTLFQVKIGREAGCGKRARGLSGLMTPRKNKLKISNSTIANCIRSLQVLLLMIKNKHLKSLPRSKIN